jgi:hypothetical protein
MNQLLSLQSLRLLPLTAIALLFGHFSAFAVPSGNTSLGVGALPGNTRGFDNTGLGFFALHANSAGNFNTATGITALSSNTNGNNNTANGGGALLFNTTGSFNTAMGDSALAENTTGHDNTAIGAQSLLGNTTGSSNVAVGRNAGQLVTMASGVTCLGAQAVGDNVSNTTWISNVYGVTPQYPATGVVVSANGQLGTMASSERFKKDIASMDKASDAILSLRPVTFHYRKDTGDTPQFGLIAEEVAKVNPALVLPDKEGKPYTVRYDAVNAMLLNEFLKEHRKVEQLEKQAAALRAGLQKVSAQLATASPSGGGLEAGKFALGRIRRGGAAPQTVVNDQ